MAFSIIVFTEDIFSINLDEQNETKDMSRWFLNF